MKTLCLLFAALPVLAGCTLTQKSKPSHYYVLPVPEVNVVSAGKLQHTIGIDPIRLPKYLDRPQLVTLTEQGRATLAEFHRWAEPFPAGFTRVLTESLSARLPHSLVTVLPARYLTPDWILEIRVNDFQVGPDDCHLKADWRISEEGNTLAWYQENIRMPSQGEDYASLPLTMSQVIDAFAARIVEKLPME